MPIIRPEGYAEPCDCTCGPNDWRLDVVPNHLFGLSIFDACCVHDWQYVTGRTEEDRLAADDLFLTNMQILVMQRTKWNWLIKLRLWKARRYYDAVRRLGGIFFWRDKKRPEIESIA